MVGEQRWHPIYNPEKRQLVMSERILQSHEFWLETCGLDTYQRSSSHARLDTPWNAFTNDDRALVCTLWVDMLTVTRQRMSARIPGDAR